MTTNNGHHQLNGEILTVSRLHNYYQFKNISWFIFVLLFGLVLWLWILRIVNGGGQMVVGHQVDQELGHFAASPPSQQFDPQYGEICTISRWASFSNGLIHNMVMEACTIILRLTLEHFGKIKLKYLSCGRFLFSMDFNQMLLRTVGTHLSTSPSEQGLPQDTVTHHSELSTPQDTQQFYKIVPQDHPQHCHPAQDQSSKDFQQYHNATARKDYQQFDTVQESQELQHFQGGQQTQDQDRQSQDYHGVEGSQMVDHPSQETGNLHQEVARQQQHQDPQQFRMQLEEMIAARQENDHRADFRKEVWTQSPRELHCIQRLALTGALYAILYESGPKFHFCFSSLIPLSKQLTKSMQLMQHSAYDGVYQCLQDILLCLSSGIKK